jgi:hypothetical protein
MGQLRRQQVKGQYGQERSQQRMGRRRKRKICTTAALSAGGNGGKVQTPQDVDQSQRSPAVVELGQHDDGTHA